MIPSPSLFPCAPSTQASTVPPPWLRLHLSFEHHLHHLVPPKLRVIRHDLRVSPYFLLSLRHHPNTPSWRELSRGLHLLTPLLAMSHQLQSQLQQPHGEARISSGRRNNSLETLVVPPSSRLHINLLDLIPNHNHIFLLQPGSCISPSKAKTTYG